MLSKTYVHPPGVATCRQCPIGTCTWHFDERKSDDWTTPGLIEPDVDALAQCGGDAMQAAVYATLHDQMLRVDDILRAHFETHSLEEWVAEVVRLRRRVADNPQVERPETWIRPSEERIENGVQELIDLVRVARDINNALDAPDSAWEPTGRQRDRFRTIVKSVLRGDAKYRFEHPEEPA